ncbi:Transcription factor BTF3 -like protein [Echinococcus granulosus]|uniref:Transcription factor BTF3 n=1 Tax=Echinococcus granulosus TaxID=6210 RepID=U6JHZ1_ECHGR|nr:Transcription factor BTF3 [Echinococcus granulosus]EUB54985.1 Transcription factor BTF3 [Echinococcus granulosus]KAH9278200.1 Transcription factor BTF3 -like protein [Echinococcus granulosus]CDS21357.1 transcription factor btf3 [Echinococcus granulosus]
MEAARLERLQALKSVSEQARIGGKGSARRKRKVVHKSAATDDKKLQATLKKLGINVIPSIEEVNMYRADGTMIHFKNPRVQASPQANMFAVSGLAENKTLNDLFPNMMSQLETAKQRLSKMSEAAQGETKDTAEDDDDDVPELVGDFEEKSRQE